MNLNPPTPGTLGAILAFLVLVVALVLGVMGSVTWLVAGLFMALALARLL